MEEGAGSTVDHMEKGWLHIVQNLLYGNTPPYCILLALHLACLDLPSISQFFVQITNSDRKLQAILVISACVSKSSPGLELNVRTVQPHEMREHIQLVLVMWHEVPLTALLILVNPQLVEGRL